jgi:hypothetical protein
MRIYKGEIMTEKIKKNPKAVNELVTIYNTESMDYKWVKSKRKLKKGIKTIKDSKDFPWSFHMPKDSFLYVINEKQLYQAKHIETRKFVTRIRIIREKAINEN